MRQQKPNEGLGLVLKSRKRSSGIKVAVFSFASGVPPLISELPVKDRWTERPCRTQVWSRTCGKTHLQQFGCT
ncbi:hypothetical protein AOLI_G00293370 [Acnodon oligacanthus]